MPPPTATSLGQFLPLGQGGGAGSAGEVTVPADTNLLVLFIHEGAHTGATAGGVAMTDEGVNDNGGGGLGWYVGCYTLENPPTGTIVVDVAGVTYNTIASAYAFADADLAAGGGPVRTVVGIGGISEGAPLAMSVASDPLDTVIMGGTLYADSPYTIAGDITAFDLIAVTVSGDGLYTAQAQAPGASPTVDWTVDGTTSTNYDAAIGLSVKGAAGGGGGGLSIPVAMHSYRRRRAA